MLGHGLPPGSVAVGGPESTRPWPGAAVTDVVEVAEVGGTVAFDGDVVVAVVAVVVPATAVVVGDDVVDALAAVVDALTVVVADVVDPPVLAAEARGPSR